MRGYAMTIAVAASGLLAASAGAAGYGLMAQWPFNGNLDDVSGRTHHATGVGTRFAAGREGQALDPQGTPVEVPDHPDLQLAPGLALDCWVYFARRPTGYEQLVLKEKEYQLRVDAESEGGRFAFFVYLNGWEPRVRGPAPEPGHWYHIVARWSGSECRLDVNGECSRSPRAGVPEPTANPLIIGRTTARLADVMLRNPVLAQARELRGLLADAGPGLPDVRFGGARGWAGWRGLAGTQVSGTTVLHAELKGSDGAIVSPTLAVDTAGVRFVCLDLDAPGVTTGHLSFVTDRGEGAVVFPVWNLDRPRTVLVDLAGCPQWRGRLRLLALSFPERPPRHVVLRHGWLSAEPEGEPFVYVRNLAPGRAALRAGREETLTAVLRNLGKSANRVSLALDLPPGVEALDGVARTLPELAFDGTQVVTWRIRASRPLTGVARLTVSTGTAPPVANELPLGFTPPLDLVRADYVPAPRPAKTDYTMLMHYCPLWKEGTHYGWGKIEPWPERRPAIGWYDEGTPEVADWHIKYALEHGIQGFIYCWYRASFDPDIKMMIGHALHDGLLKSRYLDRFKFVIMWENGCAKGVKSREDLLDNLLPFWIRNYFTHPSYLRIDGKPVLFVWRPERVAPELGGSAATKGVLDEMRAACRQAGLEGLWLVGCLEGPDRALQERYAREGWDATSAYGLHGTSPLPPGRDLEGIMTLDHRTTLLGQADTLRAKKAVGALPDIVDVMVGWDPRPWHGPRTQSYQAGAGPANFEAACRRAKEIVDATPGNGLDKRLVVFDNWNEFGEGHYIEPCAGFGFGFVDVIRNVFCNDSPPCLDITPEDVGLPVPEKVYLRRREVMGGLVSRERRVTEHVLGYWRFEDTEPDLALDSSSCQFHGLKQDAVAAAGHRGKGLLCQGGSISVPAHRLLWPASGITVEAWVKPAVAGQSDRWFVNSVGSADSGYRLGLDGGRLAWQIPSTPWSHLLTTPETLPVGAWTHVVATYDNTSLRLFVNGVEQAQLERGGVIVPSDVNLCIGNYSPGHAAAFFQGVIDELRILDRPLGADEVAGRFRETNVER